MDLMHINNVDVNIILQIMTVYKIHVSLFLAGVCFVFFMVTTSAKPNVSCSHSNKHTEKAYK